MPARMQGQGILITAICGMRICTDLDKGCVNKRKPLNQLRVTEDSNTCLSEVSWWGNSRINFTSLR